ncbi:MAG: hypothetical protein ACPGYP_09350, partial [Solirubrobacterales bacterium]
DDQLSPRPTIRLQHRPHGRSLPARALTAQSNTQSFAEDLFHDLVGAAADRAEAGITQRVFEYNSSGQMIAIDTPEGSSEITHDPQSGAVSSIETPEGQHTQMSMEGELPVGIAQTGPATGGVSVSYDNFFRMSSIGATGHTTAFGYDADSLLVSAGDLAIERNPSNGQITGSTLDSVDSTTTYNGYAEPVTRAYSTPSSTLYNETYTRDAIGRIVAKQVASSAGTDRFDYEYDAAGRLTEVKKNGAVTRHTSTTRTQTAPKPPTPPAHRPTPKPPHSTTATA